MTAKERADMAIANAISILTKGESCVIAKLKERIRQLEEEKLEDWYNKK